MSLDRVRRPAVVTAAIVGAFALLLTGVALFVPTPQSAQQATHPKPVTSLLLQIRDESKRNIASVIIDQRTGATPRTEILSVPANLQLTLPTGATIALADVTVPPYPQQAVDGLRGSAGLGIDGELVLERLGFAGLVDYVGGINVRVEVPFTTLTPGLKPVTVRPGLRHLRGIEALSYIGEGNPQLSLRRRIAHTTVVLQQLLQRITTDSYRMSQVLITAGLAARSSVPTDSLADALVAAGRAARRHNIVWKDLPTAEFKVGVSTVALVDQAKIATLVRADKLQTQTLFESMPARRVIVRDASGVPNLAAEVRRLIAQDASVAVIADGLGRQRTANSASTAVLARDPHDSTISALARSLGVTAAQAGARDIPARVDAVVYVGTDIISRLRHEL